MTGPDPSAVASPGGTRRRIGLILGPVLMLVALAAPTGLDSPAHRLAAVFALVVIYWVTEAIPLPVTALLGPSLAVLFGVAGARQAFASFGHPIIFLFLGSFLIARAMAVHGLDRRLALFVLSRPWVGESPGRILLAFGAIGFCLSMWISNTATTAMMLPIAIGVLATLERTPGSGKVAASSWATGLLLMVAYACNLGGVATPVGTPPNLIALGMLEEIAGVEISFFEWMLVALPVAAAGFGILYGVIRRLFPARDWRLEGAREVILQERATLGAWSAGEKAAGGAFSLAVTLWILPGLLTLVLGEASAPAVAAKDALPESVSALLAAAVLFILPAGWRGGRSALQWREAAHIDWGTILLFGGGLSLGALAFETGLASSLGDLLGELATTLTFPLLLLVAIIVADLLTEFMSNTATANLLIPLFLALGATGGGGSVLPVIGAAVGCSIAFCLPVATPPNAIVYSSGRVPLTSMIRAGVLLDLLCALAAWGVLLLWTGKL
jgi:sodium-dependent dicarboxylate transporter 2/3/5